jgi:endonuclease YncB( thermonuclease family)
VNGVAFRTAVCTLLAGLVLAVPAHAKPREAVVLTGEARVIDGDTIEVDGTRIRLQGIDAPETRQSCTTADGASWACGRYATAMLAAAVASTDVTCTARGRDRYQRVVAVCWAGVVEVGRSMVAEGLALADRRFGRTYVPVEDAARVAARGIWAGEFEAPWDWRRARRRG